MSSILNEFVRDSGEAVNRQELNPLFVCRYKLTADYDDGENFSFILPYAFHPQQEPLIHSISYSKTSTAGITDYSNVVGENFAADNRLRASLSVIDFSPRQKIHQITIDVLVDDIFVSGMDFYIFYELTNG